MISALFLAASLTMAADRPDLVVADFEGDTYGSWTAAGSAFGKGPARGTLPGQMAVSGFEGKGLVNSYLGGDDATGTLLSPEFRVERSYLNFLIGGGKFPGETCVELLVEGKPVRSATGPNDSPGGSERLEWASWDVRDLAGKTVRLRVVDSRKGGWGHINVDQIVQSDRRRGSGPAARDVDLTSRYLRVPVSNAAPTRRVDVLVGGAVVRSFDVKLAEGRPDFWVEADLEPWVGSSATVKAILPVDSKALDALVVTNEAVGGAGLYREADRPRFHFTSRRGWLNDPNGLVWHDGEYHLFYQHNPYGWDWGNMHWGHAVSKDLLRWSELGDAFVPREYNDWCFSGSAVVDAANTSGWGRDGKPPLVAAYTSTGRGECIAYSNDRGRTWVEYAGNPVVKHAGRDPRLLWHAPTKKWVMAVYDETDNARTIAFHTSPDLKTWTFASKIDGFFECPDLFELPVQDAPGESLWVLYAADGQYLLGTFDGTKYQPKGMGKYRLWYGNFYAAQTFSNTPDGRRIQVGWGQGITFPGMPFNQQMTIPCELTLQKTPDGPRMFAQPVAEVASLRTGPGIKARDLRVKPGAFETLTGQGDLMDVTVEVEVGEKGSFTLFVHGVPVQYDASLAELSCEKVTAPLPAEKGLVKLRVLVDRGSVEVFGNGGRVVLSKGVIPPRDERGVAIRAGRGDLTVRSIEVHPLRSAWETAKP
ncbi:MAG: GH32 C-terminal domain-containing protein [Isosphaeraceae bacterium]